MSKNVVDNLPVFVEFNQTYKLLLVSCLLDQKKFFFEVRNIPCLDKANWEERDQTGFFGIKHKEDEGVKTQNRLFVLSWSIFNCSWPNICGLKILKTWLVECTLTRQSLTKQKSCSKI